MSGPGCAGCSIETDDAPRSIGDLPDSLAEEPADDGGEAPRTMATVQVWFTTADARLLSVDRRVRPPATPAIRVEALLEEPPSRAERADGIATAIPSTTRLAGVEHQDGVLVVNLTRGLWDVQGPALRLVFGQLVCTAGEAEQVRGVLIEVDGRPVDVIDGHSRSVARPVSCADYAGLLADGQPGPGPGRQRVGG